MTTVTKAVTRITAKRHTRAVSGNARAVQSVTSGCRDLMEECVRVVSRRAGLGIVKYPSATRLPFCSLLSDRCRLRRALLATLTVPLFGTLLSACGGGASSGGSTGLGNGQDPDPVVVDFPIAYVKRPLLVDDDGNLVSRDPRDPTAFFPGAELIMRERASPTAAETVLTDGLFPPDMDGNPALYDVKDVSASFDGKPAGVCHACP